MSAFSYKEMLTNQLIVFINQRIATSKDMQDKVNSLSEEKVKKFQQKIVDSIIQKAKGLAEIQGTNYLGLMGDSGEREMTSWVDTFFDDFEENMKEPEPKPKPKAKTTGTSTKITKTGAEKKITHEIEESFFGIDVKIDKKTILSKDDFIKKIYSENEGKEITFKWENDKVEVIIKDKAEKKEKESEVTQQELDNEEIQNINEENDDSELDEPTTEEDEDEEDEDDDEKNEDEEDEDEEDEEEDGLF